MQQKMWLDQQMKEKQDLKAQEKERDRYLDYLGIKFDRIQEV